jgi:hypothetical protein
VSEDRDQKRDEEREIRVTDKRMFTAEGELREEYRHIAEKKPEAPAEAPGPAGERPAPPQAGPQGGPQAGRPAPPQGRPQQPQTPPRQPAAGAPFEIPDMGAGPAPQFLDLLGLIAEPIALYLGDATLPDGRSVENLEAARLHIDLLDVLRSKTAGNLSAQESAVLEDVLYRFRMRYVQKRG